MVIKKKTTQKPTPKVASKSPKPAGVSTPAAAVEAAVETVKMAKDTGPKIRRKEMVERIVATTGKKPNEIKSVLDGVLLELGKAISAGENLNLHPFGNITVNRQKKFDDREIIICKIRRKVEADLPSADLKTAAE